MSSRNLRLTADSAGFGEEGFHTVDCLHTVLGLSALSL